MAWTRNEFLTSTFGIFPSICKFLSDFLSSYSTADIVLQPFSFFKYINNAISEICSILTILKCSVIFSMSHRHLPFPILTALPIVTSFLFKSYPTQLLIDDERRVALKAAEFLIFLEFLIGRKNIIVFVTKIPSSFIYLPNTSNENKLYNFLNL